MAIDIGKVKTRITLEIDQGGISIADFKKASESFLDLVKEMTRQSGQAKSSEAWQVELYSGSLGIGLNPSPWFRDGDQVIAAISNGLEMLSRGERPVSFSDRAIEHVRGLASSFRKSASFPVKIWSGKDKFVAIGKEVADSADEILMPTYEGEGSVDGRIEILNAHNGTKFIVYDILNGSSVVCDIPSELLGLALQNFGRRVEVVGQAKYRKNGAPASIAAIKIIPYPDADEIPSLDQMRWLLKGAPA